MSKYLTQQLLPNGHIGMQVAIDVLMVDVEKLMLKVEEIHKLLLSTPVDKASEPDKELPKEDTSSSPSLIITEV